MAGLFASYSALAGFGLGEAFLILLVFLVLILILIPHSDPHSSPSDHDPDQYCRLSYFSKSV